ncbi:Gfo/Idh/MocA family protein [Arthrobacter sp. 35W]|uniref:Gfo/Idh/MocA family protein n=1 Tax=Arthrobacter sp. 35W TaxID=1132441 RepID=UPI000415327B|nr:Gfo/Idh/MocA family oxidoreductase [Arthrobacter sp. 35W]
MVGCGNISAQYLATIDSIDSLNLVAVTDLDPARAREAAAGRAGVRAMPLPELLADPEVDVVLNLTVPAAHAEVALAAIAAGKDVYGEKPLAATTADARRIMDAAAAAGTAVGCAPDTVLGTGIQTAREAVDRGLIGTPISATATMIGPGPEPWHPNPDFFYAPGGGPLMDMGPYYVSALITLLGPVSRVMGAASRTRDVRTIGSGPRAGESIPVSVDTHVTGLLTHASGAISTLVMSFDGVGTQASCIEVHGDMGSLVVPDPNGFRGQVQLRTLGSAEWETVATSAGYAPAGRGIGLADMAAAPGGAGGRAGGELALHALDVMESVLASAHSQQSVGIQSSCRRPAMVPLAETVPAGLDQAFGN